MSLPPHLVSLRDEALQTSCTAWADRCKWRLAAGIDRAGPCPNCGGRDRFAIHTQKDTFHCRKCEMSGHGVIDLVRKTQDVGFVEACEIITGRSADAPVAPDHARRLAEQAEKDRERRELEASRYRERAISAGRAIWHSTLTAKWRVGAVLFDYFAIRGIDIAAILDRAPDALKSLRVSLDHPWGEGQGRDWAELARAPAMVAGIQAPDDGFAGVHQTWIDLAAPKGRMILPDLENGKKRDTKKVRGTQKGCAIRLYTPHGARRIVGGEGIETTASVLCHAFEPDTAYWAFINLDNMGGKPARGATGKPVHDQPDMDDPGSFVPPGWCEELVFLSDPESEGARVTEKLTRGLRRAMRARPGLMGLIAPPPADDADYNDVAMSMKAAEGVGFGQEK